MVNVNEASIEQLRNRALGGVPEPDGRFGRLFNNNRPVMPARFRASLSGEPTRVAIQERAKGDGSKPVRPAAA